MQIIFISILLAEFTDFFLLIKISYQVLHLFFFCVNVWLMLMKTNLMKEKEVIYGKYK